MAWSMISSEEMLGCYPPCMCAHRGGGDGGADVSLDNR